jgi:hypothetical protein
MCIIHSNESSCHGIISDLVEIRKLTNDSSGFKDDDKSDLVIVGDINEESFKESVNVLGSDAIAKVDSLKINFRSLFPDLDNFTKSVIMG